MGGQKAGLQEYQSDLMLVRYIARNTFKLLGLPKALSAKSRVKAVTTETISKMSQWIISSRSSKPHGKKAVQRLNVSGRNMLPLKIQSKPLKSSESSGKTCLLTLRDGCARIFVNSIKLIKLTSSGLWSS